MNFKEYLNEAGKIYAEDIENGAVPEMIKVLKMMKAGLKHTDMEMSGVTKDTVKLSKMANKDIDSLMKSLNKLWDSQA